MKPYDVDALAKLLGTRSSKRSILGALTAWGTAGFLSTPRVTSKPKEKPCNKPKKRCGNKCVSVKTSQANCGACGRRCAVGARCTNGTCRCADVACRDLTFGEYGSAEAPLNVARGIAVDANDFVYVVDRDDDRVVKFDANGKFVLAWGTLGRFDGEFDAPFGIAIAPNGQVFVTDGNNSRVQVFTPNGKFVRQFGVTDEFGNPGFPLGVAVAPNGDAYVTDNAWVEVFGPNGDFIRTIGGDGILESPFGITFDRTGNIYVADGAIGGTSTVVKFDANGNFLQTIGERGTVAGRLKNPTYLAIGPDGNLFVSDADNQRVEVFTPTGGSVARFVAQYPYGIAFDGRGRLFLAADYPYSTAIGRFVLGAAYPR